MLIGNWTASALHFPKTVFAVAKLAANRRNIIFSSCFVSNDESNLSVRPVVWSYFLFLYGLTFYCCKVRVLFKCWVSTAMTQLFQQRPPLKTTGTDTESAVWQPVSYLLRLTHLHVFDSLIRKPDAPQQKSSHASSPDMFNSSIKWFYDGQVTCWRLLLHPAWEFT